ncbi:hypothetical protein OUZ56_000491 [Daphnia magna]|uniref:Uncharacterized protein n=1 Tax=Daphnia magna TaxID=35525 RepID=A0ABQ9ZZT7_9CRUS|nr:hypothetical protein OUZ56_000491 [Daphnia magna]
MPKIFVLRNRLQEQQARLLETQKGQQTKIRSDELSNDFDGLQDQPVALIVDRKSDITAAVAAISLSASTSDKDNCPPQQPDQAEEDGLYVQLLEPSETGFCPAQLK